MAKLACKGGEALRIEKFPVWPINDGRELKALEKVLESGVWGTLGSEVKSFESRFSSYQQAKYGVTVTNGTVTMEIILRAMGIGYGDEVIIPPYTFYSTASSVMMVGATPVFVDIDENTYNMDESKLEACITSKTKAIIPVHIGGRSCDMDKIMEFANKHNLYVVEDCAHAPGSEWKGKRVGTIGHAGSFSFQCSKNLNCGEGGFITTNDTSIYEKCWSLQNCGRDINGKVWYEHHNVGTNARMTEWQAAILNTQMERLDEQIEKRQQNAKYLKERMLEMDFVEPLKSDNRITRNSHHLFVYKYKSELCKGLQRNMFIKALNAEGIPCSPGYVCLYKQPVFEGDEFARITGSTISYKDLYLENAEIASYKEGMWITQNMLLGVKKDIDDIADAMIKVNKNVEEIL